MSLPHMMTANHWTLRWKSLHNEIKFHQINTSIKSHLWFTMIEKVSRCCWCCCLTFQLFLNKFCRHSKSDFKKLFFNITQCIVYNLKIPRLLYAFWMLFYFLCFIFSREYDLRMMYRQIHHSHHSHHHHQKIGHYSSEISIFLFDVCVMLTNIWCLMYAVKVSFYLVLSKKRRS